MGQPPDHWIQVEVDDDLRGLVPGYLDRRRGELVSLAEALSEEDFETLRKVGHDLKGTGGGYGFSAISDMGRALEQAGKDKDPVAAGSLLDQLRDFLDRVRVVYVKV